jgi:hypothetical protein
MNALGSDPPFLLENDPFILDSSPPIPPTPLLQPVNGIGEIENGTVDNEDIPEPPNLTADIVLTPSHRAIIDELFSRYRADKLRSWMVELVEKRIAKELKTYPVKIRVAIRLQLSVLGASSRISRIKQRNGTLMGTPVITAV